jgi:hypothetical protein
MARKESKIDILTDLKRIVSSLNKYEIKKFIDILKNDKRLMAEYKILTNAEFDNLSMNLNEAYLRGFDDGVNISKNNENKSTKNSNNDLESESIIKENKEIFDEENLKNKLVELFNLMKF